MMSGNSSEPSRPEGDQRRDAGPVSGGGLDRVRSEAASAEQRASFLAALAVIGLSDSVRTAITVIRILRGHASSETITLGIASIAAVIAALSFIACALAGGATLLDRSHLRLVRQAMFGQGGRAGEDIGERAFQEAAWRGHGETAKVLQAKLVLGLRCTGWFLLGGAAWVVAKVFAT